jgi:acetylornithine deacetylase/succinyl-diaminopimelate desuccinylase-like protein
MRNILIMSLLAVSVLPAQYKAIHPQVSKIAGQVSEERIAAILKKLESFGTRHTSSSQDDPVRGIGAARKWIHAEFQSYSPRLQVSYDSHRIKKQARIPADTDLHNVVAVLPGKYPDQVVISGHYDTGLPSAPSGRGSDGRRSGRWAPASARSQCGRAGGRG